MHFPHTYTYIQKLTPIRTRTNSHKLQDFSNMSPQQRGITLHYTAQIQREHNTELHMAARQLAQRGTAHYSTAKRSTTQRSQTQHSTHSGAQNSSQRKLRALHCALQLTQSTKSQHTALHAVQHTLYSAQHSDCAAHHSATRCTARTTPRLRNTSHHSAPEYNKA